MPPASVPPRSIEAEPPTGHRRSGGLAVLVTAFLLGWGCQAEPGGAGSGEADGVRSPSPDGEKWAPSTPAHLSPVAFPAAPDRLAAFLALEPPDSAARTRGDSLLRAASRLIGDGDGDPAPAELLASAHLLSEARRAVPHVADWLEVAVLDRAARAGDLATVEAGLPGLPDELAARYGWRLLSDAHLSRGDTAAAARVARTAASGVRRPDTGDPTAGAVSPGGAEPAAASRAGSLLLALGDTAGAARWLRAAVTGAPETAPALEAARRVRELVPRDERAFQAALGEAFRRHGEWRLAADHYRAALAVANVSGPGAGPVAVPASEVEGAAALRLAAGEAFFRAGRHREAEEALAPLMAPEASSRAAAEAALLLARVREARGRAGGARELLRRLTAEFPDSGIAAEAWYRLGWEHERRGRTSEAAEAYGRAAAAAPGTPAGERAAGRLAPLLLTRGRWAEAAATLEDAAGTGAGVAVLFWAGVARERAGETPVAREHFRRVRRLEPYSFYGVRAAERLRMPLLPDTLPTGPPVDRHLARQARVAALRLWFVRELDVPGAEEVELGRLQRYFSARPEGTYALADALVDGGSPLRGIRLGWKLADREPGWNLRLLRIVYPFPHRRTVVAAARRRGLEPALVAGLIRQESAFEEEIRSYAGALGLMQVMPRTGREVARRTGVRGYRTGMLRTADANLALGTAYLDEMLRRFDGAVTDALAAYNAGPHRMRRWRRLAAHGDADAFVEAIPFRQTREYVKSVRRNAALYGALYGCGGFRACLGREPALTWIADADSGVSASTGSG